MDLFDYAQALFNEQGNLWIPALGHFSKVRRSSYFAADEGKLYPPSYQIGFHEKSDNTDTAFISYFSKAKNLSQGSAKYFVDKFVENIKEELQQREVSFASLGTLYTDANSRIAFRGNDLDPVSGDGLFGLTAVKISKLDPVDYVDTKSVEKIEGDINTSLDEQPETATTIDTNVPIEEDEIPGDNITGDTTADGLAINAAQPPKKAYDPNNFYTDDRVLVLKGKPGREEKSNRYQFWISAVVIGIAVILGIYMVTQSLLEPADNAVVANKNGSRTDTAIHVSKAKSDSALVHSQDTKTLPAAVDTGLPKPTAAATLPEPVKPKLSPATSIQIPSGSWIISGGQNNNYDAAMRALNKFHDMGYAEARMIDSVKRKEYFVYKIIFGYYSTQQEAAKARILILKENKLKPKVLKVQQYK